MRANEQLDQIASSKAPRRAKVWTDENGRKDRSIRYGLGGRIFHAHADRPVAMNGQPRKGIRRYACADSTECKGFGWEPRGGVIRKSLRTSDVEGPALWMLLDLLGDQDLLAKYAGTTKLVPRAMRTGLGTSTLFMHGSTNSTGVGRTSCA